MTEDGEGAPAALLLDRYRVEGPLGEGGSGVVVEAFDTRLKRRVAIKTLKRANYTADPAHFRLLEERFAREAEAGSRMGSHPNIVGVHDLVIDAERTQHLVLEYLPGGTLAQRIARGALPVTDALRLTAEIARGLHAAHEAGLVHRDVKPANIFLTASAHAKVGDFGIAQIDDLSGRTRTTAGHPGTPLYMSPEQERMTAYLRPASDQYGLGLVAFEMLTGQIYKRTGVRQGAKLLAGQAAPVQDIITKMLADDPDDRYPTMEDVLHALSAAERQLARMETEATAQPDDAARELATTRYDTPRVALQPAAPIGHLAAPPALATPPRHTRRALLIGAVGATVGTAGVALANLRRGGSIVATATPPVATAVAAIATVTTTPPTVTPTIAPTVTSAPLATATLIVVTVPPIILTAPPIIITATPLPTPVATPTSPPTLPPPPATSPPTVPPPTPRPPPTATARPVANQVQLVPWTDPQRRFRVGYPVGWQPREESSPGVVEFIGPQIGMEIVAYRNASSTPTQQLDNIRANRPRSRMYYDEPTRSTSVGGESGAFMQFASFDSKNPNDINEGAFWVVARSGTLYQFNGYTIGPLSDNAITVLNAIIGSVTFLV